MTVSKGLHLGIIMDGNGRWAESRGLPRIAGHRRGAATVRQVVEQAPGLGVATLTLYAFSQDNWSRPRAEVAALMELFRHTLSAETARCLAEGVRITVIGRRDRLQPALATAIARAEQATAAGQKLHLRVAVDYSGRHSIQSGEVGPDVDLLIRTGGEHRLSDFLLWECAYAEILFEPCPWPEFTAAHLSRALQWFRNRNRRFGGLPLPGAAPLPLGQYDLRDAAGGDLHHVRRDRWLR